jgi:AraC family transcriptional regulator
MVEDFEVEQLQKSVVFPRSGRKDGMSIAIIRALPQVATTLTSQESHHTVFVHLDSKVRRYDIRFSDGSKEDTVSTVGGITIIPTERRFNVTFKGEAIHLCEILLPDTSPHGERFELPLLLNAKDEFLFQATSRLSELALVADDASRVLVDHLSEAIRWHLIDGYGIGIRVADPVRTQPPLSERITALLVRYISERLSSRITLDELAAVAGLSTHNLLKRFRTTFDTTPGQYIINERVKEARKLLRQSPLRITEVAVATGFYSPSHFSTVFSKHVGITPTVYRRRHGPTLSCDE